MMNVEKVDKLPERKLLVALVQRALFDLFGSENEARNDAARWFNEDRDQKEIFSFSWVCEQLDLEAAEVINKVRQMKPIDGLTTQQWWGSDKIINQN